MRRPPLARAARLLLAGGLAAGCGGGGDAKEREPSAPAAAVPASAAPAADRVADAGAPGTIGLGPIGTTGWSGTGGIGAAAAADAGVAGGVLCVAPLDTSTTPGKGAMALGPAGDFAGEPSPTPRNARAIVKVDGAAQEITLRKGARFAGLPLDRPFEVTIANPGERAYFRKAISFAKEGADALCLYENAFYATVQLSPVPRRPFCRRCMREGTP